MDYLKRKIDAELLIWKQDGAHKPLLVRGARQSGKTTAIRALGATFPAFCEINLENDEQSRRFFEQRLSPQEICSRLSLYKGVEFKPGQTLLFLDEIQSCPEAISALRYFYEEMQPLHVVASGSLLEFSLETLPTFGVGRVRSLFLYPFSFDEFLRASGRERFAEAIENAGPDVPLPPEIHAELVKWLRVFWVTGGMPEAVAAFLRKQDLLAAQQVQTDILVSLRDDFEKYRRRLPAVVLSDVLDAVVHQAGGKFVYEHAGQGLASRQVKGALDLLVRAGLVYPVTHTSANGIPLGAEANPKYRRMIPLDTGLLLRLQGLNAAGIFTDDEKTLVNRGPLAEVFVGTELVKATDPYAPASLYCWHRETPGGNAQIDYVVARGNEVVPLEVKAGTTGSMQSLRRFMAEKKSRRGIRVSLENFARYDNIEVYPLYALPTLLKMQPR